MTSTFLSSILSLLSFAIYLSTYAFMHSYTYLFIYSFLYLFTYLFVYLTLFFGPVDDLSTEIINLVPKIDKARLYRGKGGELFRQASCFLLENISRCHFLVPVKMQLTLLDLLNENLKQPHAQLRIAAASALRWCVLCSLVTCSHVKWCPMVWYDKPVSVMIWYDMIWCNVISYRMIDQSIGGYFQFNRIEYDSIWRYTILYHIVISHTLTWCFYITILFNT